MKSCKSVKDVESQRFCFTSALESSASTAPGLGAAETCVACDRPVCCSGTFRKEPDVSASAVPSAGLWELFTSENQPSAFSWSVGEKRLRRAVWGPVSQEVRELLEKLPPEFVPLFLQQGSVRLLRRWLLAFARSALWSPVPWAGWQSLTGESRCGPTSSFGDGSRQSWPQALCASPGAARRWLSPAEQRWKLGAADPALRSLLLGREMQGPQTPNPRLPASGLCLLSVVARLLSSSHLFFIC